jgi:hypothetical protein
LALCLIHEVPCLEYVWGNGVIAPPLLTLAQEGGEWSAACPGEIARGIHWIGDWMGPRPSLDAVERRKKFFPCREPNPVIVVRYPLLYRLSYPDS